MSANSPFITAATTSPDKTLRKFRALIYPREVWYFLASFIFVVAVGNLVSVIAGLRRRRRGVRTDAEGESPRTGTISYRRLHLAVVNAWRIVAFRCTVDLGKGYTINFAELFMTGTYVSILFGWSLTNTTTLAGHHKFDPTYYANRAGDIAAVQLPLIAALSMKNNIIAFLTGVSYEKLSYLHRMCARTIVILIWLHAGGRIHLGLSSDTAITENYIRSGIMGATALTLLTMVSVRPARQYSYELFLLVHFVFVLITLLGVFFHTKRFSEDHYVWPTFLLWGLDRAIRFVRLVVFNHSYFGFKSGLGTFNATAEPIAHGFVRLRFRRPCHLHWRPGQSVFLTMPGVSTVPFESHPFTIANADLNHNGPQEFSEENEKNDSVSTTAASHGKDLVFVVKAREGFTRHLGAIANDEGTLKVFVDGPYGAPPRLFGYDTSVFIAGGSGVTYTSPLFVDLVHRTRASSSACRNFVFIWAVRDPSHVNLVYDDLLDSLRLELPGCNIDVRIHITSPDADSIASSETSSVRTGVEGNEKATFKISRLPNTRIENGRPNVQSIIEEASSLARGDMSVTVCGPTTLTADVRKALRTSAAGPMSVLTGGPSISLFVESFGYA